MALMYDGIVDVAYIPVLVDNVHPEKGYKVIGLSKIPRIVEMCSKRLQLQERIGNDILYIVKKITNSNDIIVRIEGCHSCVTARGIKKRSKTTTISKIGKIGVEVFM